MFLVGAADCILWGLVGCRRSKCTKGWCSAFPADTLDLLQLSPVFTPHFTLLRKKDYSCVRRYHCLLKITTASFKTPTQALPAPSSFNQLQITFLATGLSWVHKYLILLPLSYEQRGQSSLHGALWPRHSLLNCDWDMPEAFSSASSIVPVFVALLACAWMNLLGEWRIPWHYVCWFHWEGYLNDLALLFTW